jgi:FkbM family methyltransferase
MTIRSIGLRLIDRIPSLLAARLKGESRFATVLRPFVNWLLPDGQQVVTVRSGRAAGIRLEIHPRSEKYYWLGTYEPHVLDEIARRLRADATFWDVGSHLGYMVAVASRLVGPTGAVVAFEPNPENIRRLRRTIELNDLQNVVVREVALSDHVGQSDFYIGSASSMGSLLQGSTPIPSMHVPTSTADTELEGRACPDLVKIDVEGSESMVLAGAGALLECRPDLIVEVLTPDQRIAVAERLVGYETSMLDERNMLAVPNPAETVAVR